MAQREIRFKKGQWLIRRWKKLNGGEYDIVLYEKLKPGGSHFYFNKFFRVGKRKVEDLTNEEGVVREINFIDYRMEFQWRSVTKNEMLLLFPLILKSI